MKSKLSIVYVKNSFSKCQWGPGEMAQWVKRLEPEAWQLEFDPQNAWWKGRTDSQQLFSSLRVCALIHMCLHVCHIQTHNKNNNKLKRNKTYKSTSDAEGWSHLNTHCRPHWHCKHCVCKLVDHLQRKVTLHLDLWRAGWSTEKKLSQDLSGVWLNVALTRASGWLA